MPEKNTKYYDSEVVDLSLDYFQALESLVEGRPMSLICIDNRKKGGSGIYQGDVSSLQDRLVDFLEDKVDDTTSDRFIFKLDKRGELCLDERIRGGISMLSSGFHVGDKPSNYFLNEVDRLCYDEEGLLSNTHGEDVLVNSRRSLIHILTYDKVGNGDNLLLFTGLHNSHGSSSVDFRTSLRTVGYDVYTYKLNDFDQPTSQ